MSSGTGAAVARRLARDPGLAVFGMHRGHHPAGAEAVLRELREQGRKALELQADAGCAEGAAQGCDALLRSAGPRSVEVFVHAIANASLGRLATGPEPVSARQVHKTFESMCHSFVYWSQALVERDLLAPEALLLALGNPLVDSLVRNGGLINATKAALEQYVRQLAYELGPLGHRVNLLKFGAVVTPAVEQTFDAVGVARLRTVLERAIPAGRLGTVDEVAAFVSVLCSPAGRWFNGATIDFTGAQAQSLFDALLYPPRSESHGRR
jgi:NAD(P)-dependent dehydrogenase (short-subunit alcohol dehydrogenase family)